MTPLRHDLASHTSLTRNSSYTDHLTRPSRDEDLRAIHLRDQGFVTASRQGRHVENHLDDDHIGELIEQALSRADHARLGLVDRDDTNSGLDANP